MQYKLVFSLCMLALGLASTAEAQTPALAVRKPLLAPQWQPVPQFNTNNPAGSGLVSAPFAGSSPIHVQTLSPQMGAEDNGVMIPATGPNDAEPNMVMVPVAPAAFVPHGYVEAGVNYHVLTKGFDNWSGEYLKGQVQVDADNSLRGTLLNQREFGDTGNYLSVGNTHRFNDDWYSNLDVGASTGGSFLPSYRIDAFLNRKWLDQRQLVTTVGVGYYDAREGYSDRSLFLGAAYYFSNMWVVQGGIRFNQSNPGSVNSISQFMAVTQGREKDHLFTVRYGFGKEAYQIIGPGSVLSEFYSHSLSFELRQWLGQDWGINVLGETYISRNYDRNGVIFGVFKEF